MNRISKIFFQVNRIIIQYIKSSYNVDELKHESGMVSGNAFLLLLCFPNLNSLWGWKTCRAYNCLCRKHLKTDSLLLWNAWDWICAERIWNSAQKWCWMPPQCNNCQWCQLKLLVPAANNADDRDKTSENMDQHWTQWTSAQKATLPLLLRNWTLILSVGKINIYNPLSPVPLIMYQLTMHDCIVRKINWASVINQYSERFFSGRLRWVWGIQMLLKRH